jgi:hypothetical protein
MVDRVQPHEEPLTIDSRIRQQVIARCRQRNLQPAWIIMGQAEWLEFKTAPDRKLGDNYLMTPGAPATFMGVPIAVCPSTEHCLEVLPRLMRY